MFGTTTMALFFLKRLKREKRAEGSNSTARRTAATETTQTRPYVANHWYFRLDTPRILCVALPLSLIGHSRITPQFCDILRGHAGAYGK
jgi:hypothetical protein